MYLKSTLALSLALAVLGGCSSSSSLETADASSKDDGNASGKHDGATRDAGPPDTGAGCTSSFSADAGVTWTDLYRDYFGPSGKASCAGDGNCHGATTQAGYASSGFLCPSGDKSGCYTGLTLQGDAGPDLIEPDASFSDDNLSLVLCQCNGGGTMPFGCSYIFTAVDVTRIQDWIAAGAQDN
jgi:hypothetical protein